VHKEKPIVLGSTVTTQYPACDGRMDRHHMLLTIAYISRYAEGHVDNKFKYSG